MGPDPAFFQILEQEQLFKGQQDKVVQAPADKVPVCTVPDAGEQLHHEQVEDLPLQALAVAAQRDIDILAEPAGKGHVPAPPELGDRTGDIGEVEVLGEIEAQHLAHADGHQGVTGKIKVELERVGDDTQPDQRRGRIGKAHKGGGRAVGNADDVCPERADGIRQQDLFCQTEGEQGHAFLDLLQAVTMLVNVQLGRDIPILDDGARDELGEHDNISAEVDDVVLSLYLPAVDINGVGKGLEGIKADAQRQDADALNGRKSGAQQAVDAAQDKVCVLEVEQHPQAGCKGDQQQHLAHAGLCVKRFQPQAAEIVDEDQGQHDREEPDLTPAVEHQAAHKEHRILELCGRKVIQRQRNGKKPEQKDDGAENQGFDLLLKKELLQMPSHTRCARQLSLWERRQCGALTERACSSPIQFYFTLPVRCPPRCPDRQCTRWKR